MEIKIKYNLFLDDIREPNSSWMSYKRELKYDLWNWEVVRNYEEFVGKIQELGIPDFVSYDHDLAESHYDVSMDQGLDSYQRYLDGIELKEKTGLECAEYLVSILGEGQKHPPYIVHSMNPVGKQRIENFLLRDK